MLQTNEDLIPVHYAFQACDTKSYQGHKRFCTDDRTELSKKSLMSFITSVQYTIQRQPNSIHTIAIFEDQCSENYKSFIQKVITKYTSDNVQFEMISLDGKGLGHSIKSCYNWLIINGKNLVYQVQDDYMFMENSIHETIDMFYHVLFKYKLHPVIQPYNDPHFLQIYDSQSVPRMIMLGKTSYWMQIYDTCCTFLTSHDQFLQHQDLYDKFYDLVDLKIRNKNQLELENKSLNYMFTRKGVLGLAPMSSLTFHMQTELERDPFIDWRPIWDKIDIDI